MIIREEGEGSLEVRTSEPITTGNSPIGFNSRSLKIESGSISSNIEICLGYRIPLCNISKIKRPQFL